jgi:hypothetical protein
MMKQIEDAGEKIGVGTGVDLLSCVCIISLPFHPILLSVNSTRTPLSVCYAPLLSFTLHCWLFGQAVGLTRPSAVYLPTARCPLLWLRRCLWSVCCVRGFGIGSWLCHVSGFVGLRERACWHWRLFGNG